MSYSLKITVTKEIIEKSKNCGKEGSHKDVGAGSNCAIALAVRDIFPNAWVCRDVIMPFVFEHVNDFYEYKNDSNLDIKLPYKATRFIDLFDSSSVEQREEINAFEFDVNVPDSVIDRINIEEIKPILENHSTLKLQTA